MHKDVKGNLWTAFFMTLLLAVTLTFGFYVDGEAYWETALIAIGFLGFVICISLHMAHYVHVRVQNGTYTGKYE